MYNFTHTNKLFSLNNIAKASITKSVFTNLEKFAKAYNTYAVMFG